MSRARVATNYTNLGNKTRETSGLWKQGGVVAAYITLLHKPLVKDLDFYASFGKSYAICYVVNSGRELGAQSVEIHEKQCMRKFENE